MQKNWIGKSTGCEIQFKLQDAPINFKSLNVYTTRPDTIFGMSFCGISPNHPLAQKLALENKQIRLFIKNCERLGNTEEAVETTEKEGVDTGIKVMHPFIPNKTVPLFIANFILMDYGTGAIFGCPAHDQRDLDFAYKYNLNVKTVVAPEKNSQNFKVAKEAYTGPGYIFNSNFLDGLKCPDESIIKTIEYLENKKFI